MIVAYTKNAATHYMDVKRELVEMSIEEGNHAFRNSKIYNVLN
mgnify:CR=1 FL=1